MARSDATDQPGPDDRGPAGERWDDGKGERRRSGPNWRQRLPRWALPAAIAAVVLLVVVVVVVASRGGGGSSDAGSCLQDLSAHLPASTRLVDGTDLVAARQAGYDDGSSLEDLGDSQRESGALPDALTEQYRYQQLFGLDDFTARTGVEPKDVECSLGSAEETVLSGSFDPAEVNGSAAAADGRLRANEDRLALVRGDGAADTMLEPLDGGGLAENQAAMAVLESLRQQGSYSVLVQVGGPRATRQARAAGFGVARPDEGGGDEKALVVAWSFADDDAAAAGRPQVVERVNDALKGTTSISAADLTLDGSLVRAKIATRRAPDLYLVLRTKVDLIVPGS